MTYRALKKSERKNRVAKRSAQTPPQISHARWAAYATAGAASALTFANSAEADSFYSGIINRHFDGRAFARSDIGKFPLEGGAVFSIGNAYFSPGGPGGLALFRVRVGSGTQAPGNSFAGKAAGSHRYVYKLNFGALISAQNFVQNRPQTGFGYKLAPATMAYKFSPYPLRGQWFAAGTSFIGFKFNDGTGGIDYGWARVTMDGTPTNTFTLDDYFFSDNNGVRAGSTGSVPDSGSSLGLLALGCVGLLAWRKQHAKAAVVE